MHAVVDYRLLERFEASRRRNAPPGEKLEWLERLRVRAERDTERASADDRWPRVRALDLRD